MTARSLAILAGAFAIVASTAAATGEAQPTIFRTVTMDGVQSTAYYSVVERRYVFVGAATLEALAAQDADALIAPTAALATP